LLPDRPTTSLTEALDGELSELVDKFQNRKTAKQERDLSKRLWD
jgi:hypothetical protein